jgi:flavodoxin
MEIRKAKLVYYSPTGTGKTTVTAILNGTGLDHAIIDLTPPDSEINNYDVSSDELAIIEAPVYSGRISTVAKDRIKNLKGTNTPAGLVVMYGNRAFEDALLELKKLTSELPL